MGKLARLIVPPLDVLYDLLGWFQPKVGEWYSSIYTYYLAGVDRADVPANYLRALYYPIFRKIRFDRIGIRVVGAGGAGARIRLGIYDDKNFYPNSLIVDAGEVSATVAGNLITTIDQTLEGAHWLVCNTNDSTIDLRYPYTFIPLSGTTPSAFISGYYISQTYGRLPDSFPAGASKTSYDAVMMALRVAEVY